MLRDAIDTLISQGGLTDMGSIQPPKTRELEYQIAILDEENHDAYKKEKKEGRKGRVGSQSLRLKLRCNVDGGYWDSQGRGFMEEFDVELFTPPGARSSSWSAIGPAGEVPTKPRGEECAQKIRSWLDNCDRNHKLCQTSRPPNQAGPLPKRVLDLSDNRILLAESSGRIGHYVALSHSWGKEELLTTTRDTLFERMRRINLQDLPQTFRDAVNITRWLGIRYLWIDSLCIIQDDKLDWEQQSAAMADIYSECYLNIATTRSLNALEGCLGARWTSRDTLEWADTVAKETDPLTKETISRIRKCEVRSFRVPTNSRRTSQAIRIRLALDSSHEVVKTARWNRKYKETAPLLQRAWVYQEQALSPRTVHLHANEMVWVCKVEQLCECKTLDGKPPGKDSWSAFKHRVSSLGELTTKQELHGLWRTIVEEHSFLNLTYESDRLPSLFGLASRFANNFPQQERYLAGVWESDLPRGLLWAAGDNKQAAGPMRQKLSKSFGVPSWSWAALTWGCNASGIDWEAESKPKPTSWAPTVTYEQDSRLSIVSASGTVDKGNIYGAVSGGSIVLEGAVCAVVKIGVSKDYFDAEYDTESDDESDSSSEEWYTAGEEDDAKYDAENEDNDDDEESDKDSYEDSDEDSDEDIRDDYGETGNADTSQWVSYAPYSSDSDEEHSSAETHILPSIPPKAPSVPMSTNISPYLLSPPNRPQAMIAPNKMLAPLTSSTLSSTLPSPIIKPQSPTSSSVSSSPSSSCSSRSSSVSSYLTSPLHKPLILDLLSRARSRSRSSQSSRSTTSISSSIQSYVTAEPYNVFNSLRLSYDTVGDQHAIETAKDVEGGTVYCLYIGTFTETFDDEDENPQLRHRGLILRPSSRVPGAFERIGRWTQYIEHWVKNKEVFTKESKIIRVEIV